MNFQLMDATHANRCQYTNLKDHRRNYDTMSVMCFILIMGIYRNTISGKGINQRKMLFIKSPETTSKW